MLLRSQGSTRNARGPFPRIRLGMVEIILWSQVRACKCSFSPRRILPFLPRQSRDIASQRRDCLSKRERREHRCIDSRNIVLKPYKGSRTWDNSDDDFAKRIKPEYLTGERMRTGAYTDHLWTSLSRLEETWAGIECDTEWSFAHRLAATANGIGARSEIIVTRWPYRRRPAAQIAHKISAWMLRPVPYLLQSFEPTCPAGRTCVARVNVASGPLLSVTALDRNSSLPGEIEEIGARIGKIPV